MDFEKIKRMLLAMGCRKEFGAFGYSRNNRTIKIYFVYKHMCPHIHDSEMVMIFTWNEKKCCTEWTHSCYTIKSLVETISELMR